MRSITQSLNWDFEIRLGFCPPQGSKGVISFTATYNTKPNIIMQLKIYSSEVSKEGMATVQEVRNNYISHIAPQNQTHKGAISFSRLFIKRGPHSHYLSKSQTKRQNMIYNLQIKCTLLILNINFLHANHTHATLLTI